MAEICYAGDELSGSGTPDSPVEEAHYLASVVSMCTCSGGGLLRGYQTIEERLYQVLTVEERGIKPHHADSVMFVWCWGEGGMLLWIYSSNSFKTSATKPDTCVCKSYFMNTVI